MDLVGSPPVSGGATAQINGAVGLRRVIPGCTQPLPLVVPVPLDELTDEPPDPLVVITGDWGWAGGGVETTGAFEVGGAVEAGLWVAVL